jgi:hypothetical protein
LHTVQVIDLAFFDTGGTIPIFNYRLGKRSNGDKNKEQE